MSIIPGFDIPGGNIVSLRVMCDMAGCRRVNWATRDMHGVHLYRSHTHVSVGYTLGRENSTTYLVPGQNIV